MVVALSAIAFPFAISSPSYAESPEPSSEPGDDSDQQELKLTDGAPTSTSPADIRLEDGKITWTPTGVAGLEDTYEVMVARKNLAEGSDRLSEEIVMSPTGLTKAELDLAPLGEGTYYWQVRSCTGGSACKDWSAVYTVNVDGTAPGAPTAEVVSGQYDQTVILRGSAEADGRVTIRIGEHACEATVAHDSAWTCTFAEGVEFGDYEAQVVAFDKAGNPSLPFLMELSVKELFVAPPITAEELPAVLEIVPVSAAVENKVFKQPISAIDSVNLGNDTTEPIESVLGVAHPLSTEGGIVQSSENGWQLLGVPWFLWAGIGGMLSAGWFMYAGRPSRPFALS